MNASEFDTVQCALGGLDPMTRVRENEKKWADERRIKNPENATRETRLVREFLLDPSMTLLDKLELCNYDGGPWDSEQHAEADVRWVWSVISGDQTWPMDEKNAQIAENLDRKRFDFNALEYSIIFSALKRFDLEVGKALENAKATNDSLRKQDPTFAAKELSLVREYLLDPTLWLSGKLRLCGISSISRKDKVEMENNFRKLWDIYSSGQPWPLDE